MAERRWRGYAFVGVSVDGFLARSDGDISWLIDPPPGLPHVKGFTGSYAPPPYEIFMEGIDHVVLGRNIYEKVCTFGYWPYPNRRVIVLSTTLPSDIDERVTVARSLEEVCVFLDAGDAGGVYVDGGRVVSTFLRAHLLEEMTITVAPVILGGGFRFMQPFDEEFALTHLGTTVVDMGRVITRYGVHYS